MIRRALAAAALFAGILLGSSPARAAYPDTSLRQHGHRNAADGGTITSWPYTVSFSSGAQLPATSTFTILGASNFPGVLISSGDITVATFTPTIFSGVSLTSRTCEAYIITQTTMTTAFPVAFFNGVKSGYAYETRSSNATTPVISVFTGNVAFPLYGAHISASSLAVNANKQWTTQIRFHSADNATTTDYNLESYIDTAWNTGYKARHDVSGSFSGGAPTALSLGISAGNSIDVTGAISATSPFNGVHWELYCAGFQYR